MDYEKKYKEALERARDLISRCKSNRDRRAMIYRVEDIKQIFSELEDSEDEKIRKAIIAFIKKRDRSGCDYDYNQWITWLENQHTNPYSGVGFDCYGHHWGMCARDNGVEIIFDGELKAFLSSEKSFIYPIHPQMDITTKSAMEVIKEENVGNPEPKFKVGDWIVDNCGNVWQIVEVSSNFYRLKDINEFESLPKIKWVDDTFHLWSIQDAKPGDVLASELCYSIILYKGIEDGNIQFYCDYDFSDIDMPGDRFSINSGQHYGNVKDSTDFHPATKEQRDTLFTKMKEAGYKWDAEKKELKKISQRMISAEAKEALYNKPSWSEEDEEMINNIIDYMKPMPIFFESTKGKNGKEYTKEFVKEAIKWLKSIKQRLGE